MLNSPINTSSIANSNLIIQPTLNGAFLKDVKGNIIFDFNDKHKVNNTLKFKALLLPDGLAIDHVVFLEILARKGVVLFYPEHLKGVDLEIVKNLESKNLAYKEPSFITDSYVDSLSVRTKRLAWQERTLNYSVSVVLCTNRVESLKNILPQIYSQKHKLLELIVVNHGGDREEFARQIKTLTPSNSSVTTTSITVPKEISFGNAFNKGCSIAQGKFIAKIDDDDFYSPYHVTDLLIPVSFENFAIVGKPLHHIYVEPLDTTFLKKPHGVTGSAETVSSWVAGGTMLISKDFGSSVGWFSDINSGIDRDIQSKALTSKNLIYKTHGGGYVYSRTNNEHTWKTSWERYMQGSYGQKLGIYGNF